MFDRIRPPLLALALCVVACDPSSGPDGPLDPAVGPSDRPDRPETPLLFGSLSDVCDGPPLEVHIEDAVDLFGCVYCAQMFDCACDSGRLFDSEATCRRDVEDRVARLRQAGEDAGLTYDPSCLVGFLEEVDAGGCGPRVYDFSQCHLACSPYHGSHGIDQGCEYFSAGLHDCAKGLVCLSGVCQDPCGDGPSEGESCERRVCADGLYCDQTQTCSALPTVGQPCPFGACADGAYCDALDPVNMHGVLECFAVGANGEACRGHAQCESSHCFAGKCAPMLTEGETCPAQVCGPGLSCKEGVCEYAEPAVCHAGTPI